MARNIDDKRRQVGDNLPATGRTPTGLGQGPADDERSAAMAALPGLAEVPVRLRVILGGSKISFKDAANLTQKSLLPIDRTASDPVDIVVNGKLIARGKLVIIDDTYGVQITELTGQ